MELFHTYLLPCVYAFLACLGFSIVFNIKGAGALICCFGAALGWLAYLCVLPALGSDVAAAFFAAMVIAAYSEVMARLRRCPVSGYLMVALLPLVPGGGIYYSMSYCVQGDTQHFLSTLLHTFGMAAALAVGAMISSSVMRSVLPKLYHNHTNPKGGRQP